jgi:hypothetical protein
MHGMGCRTAYCVAYLIRVEVDDRASSHALAPGADTRRQRRRVEVLAPRPVSREGDQTETLSDDITPVTRRACTPRGVLPSDPCLPACLPPPAAASRPFQRVKCGSPAPGRVACLPPTLPARRVAPVATGRSPHGVRASTANGHVTTSQLHQSVLQYLPTVLESPAYNRLFCDERAKRRPADPSRPCAGPDRRLLRRQGTARAGGTEAARPPPPPCLTECASGQVGPRPMAWRQCALRSAGRDAPACLPDLLALSTHLTPVAIATRRTPFSASLPTAARQPADRRSHGRAAVQGREQGTYG